MFHIITYYYVFNLHITTQYYINTNTVTDFPVDTVVIPVMSNDGWLRLMPQV